MKSIRNIPPQFELFIMPFVTIVGLRPTTKSLADGSKKHSYWETAHKLLSRSDLALQLSRFDAETINSNVFKKVEKMLDSEHVSIELA